MIISDIDYEYPANSEQGQGFADLLTELRKGFAALKDRKGDSTPYLISAAVAAGPKHYAHYKVPQMNAAIDFWNLMVPFSPCNLSLSHLLTYTLWWQSYDYSGSWITWADNAANVFGGQKTGFQTDSALKWFLAHGASPDKINLGG